MKLSRFVENSEGVIAAARLQPRVRSVPSAIAAPVQTDPSS
jgi:hypothetical protein